MRYSLSTLALTALASSCACVSALGINCRGSFACSLFALEPTAVADTLNRLIMQNVHNTNQYEDNQDMACVDGNGIGSICAFPQNTGGISGREIKTLAQRIVDHGCRVCGSAPVDDENNDVGTMGELTINFVNRGTGGGD